MTLENQTHTSPRCGITIFKDEFKENPTFLHFSEDIYEEKESFLQRVLDSFARQLIYKR